MYLQSRLLKSKTHIIQFKNYPMNQQRQEQQSQSSLNSPPLIYRIKQYKSNSILGQFTYMLIRPPRFMYNEQLLYPPEAYQVKYRVEHHQIPFKLTLYRPQNMMYVVLYLHGNSSSRFQGYMNLKDLPDGVGLACFDFNGCGMRFDNQYITLGSKESKEVDIAAKYLKGLGYKVVGWGRSMGSVSLLLSSEIDIMVADSPFYSLVNLCEEISYKATPSVCCCFFHCLYPCLFSCVRSDVQQKAGFDMRQMEVAKILANNPKNKQKCLFVLAGSGDGMIHFSHSQKIYEAFPGTKQIEIFEGTHNSNRPQQVLEKCFDFIDKQLGIARHKVPKKHNIRLKPINKIQSKSMEIKIRSRANDNTQQYGESDGININTESNIQKHMLELENSGKRQEIQSLESIKNVEIKEEIVSFSKSPDKQVSIKKETIETSVENLKKDCSRQVEMRYDNFDRKNSGRVKPGLAKSTQLKTKQAKHEKSQKQLSTVQASDNLISK